jgi:hypothetical protein
MYIHCLGQFSKNQILNKNRGGCLSELLINLQEDIAWSALVKLFDPVKSPRCYAVIALKKQQ